MFILLYKFNIQLLNSNICLCLPSHVSRVSQLTDLLLPQLTICLYSIERVSSVKIFVIATQVFETIPPSVHVINCIIEDNRYKISW